MIDNNGIVNTHTREYIRIALERSMEQVTDRPFILVVAPSGYGKSTFVRHFFENKKDVYTVWFPMQSDENWKWKRLCKKVGDTNKELNEKISEVELPKSKQERSYVINI